MQVNESNNYEMSNISKSKSSGTLSIMSNK
jgi:hypothetical protein